VARIAITAIAAYRVFMLFIRAYKYYLSLRKKSLTKKEKY
jgi:hypothetical protein